MECLVKYVSENCEVNRYNDFNNIDDYRPLRRKPKAGKWTFQDTLKTKDDYLKYYAVKTCAVNLIRTTIVLENDENKKYSLAASDALKMLRNRQEKFETC